MSDYIALSLFSGCGGMDMGLMGGFDFLGKTYDRHPITVGQAIEFDKKAVSVYNDNFNHPCELRDILEVKNDEVIDHDIMVGGFPCQSFSVCNLNRLGYTDARGQLFFEMVRLLKAKKPRCFIAENVRGLLSANEGHAFRLIINEFKKCGYFVKHKILKAKYYGIPQKRERVFIMGFRDESDLDHFQFPEPTTHTDFIPLKRVLEPRHAITEDYYFSERAVMGMFRAKKNNPGWANRKGNPQNIEEPSDTVISHMASYSLCSTDPCLLDQGRYRKFTPREVARIQSFPESFKLATSKSASYHVLGNAVPPVLMWHVASAMLRAFTREVYYPKQLGLFRIA